MAGERAAVNTPPEAPRSVGLGQRAVESLATLTLADSALAYRVCLCLLFAIFGAAAVASISAGPLIQVRFGHDTPLLLDGGWKVLWGARPHLDFYSSFGDATFLLVALAMKIAGPTAQSLPVANAIFGAGVAAATWVGGRRRFSASVLLIFTLFTTFVAISAHQLRFPYWETTYTIIYNRHGYALVALLAGVLFVAPRSRSDRGELIDGLIVGGVTVLLLFIKITFFLVAGAFILCGLVLRPISRRSFTGLLAGAALVGLPFLLYLRFDLWSYYQDLSIAAAARRGTLSIRTPMAYLLSLKDQLQWLAIMALPLYLLWLVRERAPSRLRAGIGAAVVAAAFVGCSVFIMSTNAPDGPIEEVPLLVSAAFIIIGTAARLVRSEPGEPILREHVYLYVVSCVSGVIFVGSTFTRDFVSVGYGAYIAVARAPLFGPSDRINTASMRNMIFTGISGDPGLPTTYPDKINDGLKLLDEHVAPNARIESFDFTNPFPFASQRPPNPGGPVAWQSGFTISPRKFPAAERVLGRADAVMVPKFPGNPGTPELLASLYGDYMKRHFATAAESLHWVLLKRVPAPTMEPQP